MIEICHARHLWKFNVGQHGYKNNFEGLAFSTQFKSMESSRNIKFAHNVVLGMFNI